MRPIESNVEAILVAVPMLLVLAVSFFRLDECFGNPEKQVSRRKGFSYQDGTGAVICIEPDGQSYRAEPGR